MEAAVTALLRILYIILALDQGNVILAQKALRQFINIIRKRTDDPDTGDVTDILLNAFQRHGNIFPADLTQNTVMIPSMGFRSYSREYS